ncbi:hypothetical protein GB931_12130 [Modestobacter sp. I12A-02628]|uniref:Uncharacterized protein n=1 Tax=Goekera deserti TaxID=2497753 RepID=A0A7K3W911_9ACTN|nr:hypothetical protein [Goekera deserti]MPQ98655.1 hypothetical protein [Goekera deserti]NDI49217.1 hypothetical protein [Goekera deserti]NEL52955.1 hypothetical protein [Goekera deserti]
MTSPDDEPDPTGLDQPAGRAQPLWWVAVPALVAGFGGYQLLQGDTGGIWPWGPLVLLLAGLGLLAFVLVDRRR